MAKNIIQGGINRPVINVGVVTTIPVANTSTPTPTSGMPCAAGSLVGVAEGDIDATTGFTTINTNCIAELAVTGKTTGGGNAAINAGDILYLQTDGSIDKNSSGTNAVKFGTAFGNAISTNPLGTDTRSGQLVASGATTTIRVWVGKTGA